MRDENKKRLGWMFTDWVRRLPHDEVLRRYRALTWNERLDVESYAFAESATLLNSDEGYGDRFEVLARCFDIFADADDAPPLLSSEHLFRDRAHELRHPEQWREEQRAAAQRNQLTKRRRRAMALASSCWADEPPDARLRRIEQALPELRQLAGEAVAEEDFDDESAIGEDIAGLLRLRDTLGSMS